MPEQPVISQTVVPAPQEIPAETPKSQNTTEQAPEAAPTEQATEKSPAETPPNKGEHRVSRKIDRLTKEAAQRTAEAEFYKRQWEESNKAKTQPGEPKLEDFTDIQEYAKAYAKHESGKVLKEFESNQRALRYKQAEQRLVSDWEQRSSEATQEDFDTVVGELRPTNTLTRAVMKSHPDVAYFLGKNISEATRIANLDEIDQIREIGKLEAKLAVTPPKPQTSKAPAPITPVKGVADTSGEPDPADTEKWIKWRQKQVHGKR